MKFLIDECLAPALAQLARARGFPESTHVSWLGLASCKDWTIARRAIDGGFILVTDNTMDFAVWYAREDIHAGLVCLNVAHGRMSLQVQKQLFVLSLDELGGEEAFSEIVEITVDGQGTVTINRYALPRKR